MKRSCPIFTMAALLAAAVFLRFALTGYSFSAMLCAAGAGVVGFYTFVPKLFKKSRTVIRLFTILLILILLAVCITEGFIIHASFGAKDPVCDYLVVLGAKVNPSGTPSLALKNRIDAAYDYLTAHPDAIAILSGGQGPDEPMTEARCMQGQLMARGIDPDRLWLEDRSANTWENLKFTRALLEEKTGSVPGQIALLSNEFHLFRAGLFARRLGFEAAGIPAATTLPFLKVNYFLREAAAVWYYLIFGGKIYG